MATLNLTKSWVNLLDTGEGVSGYSDDDRSQQHGMDGEVRTLAGGRQRSITREGVRGSIGRRLVAMTKTDIDTLRSWISRPVQYRDHRGQLFVGVYFTVDVGEYKEPTLYSADIELRLVSHTTGV